MLNVPYEPAVSVCAKWGPSPRIVITDRQCAARAQAGVFRHFARIHAVTRSDDRRIVSAVDRHRDVMLCAVCRRPVKVSVNVSPSPSSWTASRVVIQEYVRTPSVPMLNVPYEPAVSVCAVKVASPASSSLMIVNYCRPCSSWCLPSFLASAIHPFRWPAHRWCRWSSPWCHALCRLPTSLWRFPLTRIPVAQLLNCVRVVIQSTSTRHRCRCWTCRMSLPCRFAPWRGRFARIVITLIVSVPPVLKLVSSVTSPASAYPFRPAHRWCRWSSPWCHALCRLPTSVKVSVNVSPSPSSWTASGRYSESTSTRHRCRCWTCRMGLPCPVCAGPVQLRYIVMLIVSVPPVLKLVCFRHFARITPSPVPMTGASLVPLIVTVMSCSVPSADVTVKVSLTRIPVASSWTASRSLFRGTSTPSVPMLNVPYGPPCRFAREGRLYASSSLIVGVPPVLKLVSSTSLRPHHAVTRSMTGASLVAVDRHRDVMLCAAVHRRHCEGFRPTYPVAPALELRRGRWYSESTSTPSVPM